MAQFNVLSKQCPKCSEKAVVLIDEQVRFKPPTHRCRNCSAELRTVFTPQALWSIPIGFIALGTLYLALTLLQQSQAITGVS
jgi:hypothetical protein